MGIVCRYRKVLKQLNADTLQFENISSHMMKNKIKMKVSVLKISCAQASHIPFLMILWASVILVD
jgi:hypothetical protein